MKRRYYVTLGSTAKELADNVDNLQVIGYLVVGGVSIAYDSTQKLMVYAQAVVKETEDAKSETDEAS